MKEITYGIRRIIGKIPVENHTIKIEAIYVMGKKNNPTKIVHTPKTSNITYKAQIKQTNPLTNQRMAPMHPIVFPVAALALSMNPIYFNPLTMLLTP